MHSFDGCTILVAILVRELVRIGLVKRILASELVRIGLNRCKKRMKEGRMPHAKSLVFCLLLPLCSLHQLKSFEPYGPVPTWWSRAKS